MLLGPVLRFGCLIYTVEAESSTRITWQLSVAPQLPPPAERAGHPGRRLITETVIVGLATDSTKVGEHGRQ